MSAHHQPPSGIREHLERHGQAHLLAFWPELSDAQRETLLADIAQIDLRHCEPLIGEYVKRRPTIDVPERIEPARVFPADGDPASSERYVVARRTGEAAIRAGAVAAFTVAGGQGTRLGFDGPKGAFQISPIRGATLYQLFAEQLLGLRRRYGTLPRWYIMTSPLNHDETLAFFHEHAYFGLPRSEVTFFQQRQMAVFLPDGRIALAEKHRVALSPDGHGGSLRALAESGALADMRGRGIEYISYFQVDNPLVRVIDPLFVGLHIAEGSEMSSKAVTKADDLERVGNFCLADGKLTVIEYSDMPESLATAKNADGTRQFDAGSIAIHVLSRDFVERLTSEGSGVRLPWHRADKKVIVVDEAGRAVVPTAPNVVKLEMFVFDAIPLARNPIVLYTDRAEEFSPVKNAEGVDSPASARRDLLQRAARWLRAAGVTVACNDAGDPVRPVEISPAFALDADDLRDRLADADSVDTGGPLLLV